MNSHIKNALLNGRLVLLLGAGASRGCQNTLKEELPLGLELAKILAEEMGEHYSDEDLSAVYSAAKVVMGAQLNTVFEKHFKHCIPSREYIELVKYPFFRIYTLNIDDAFEKAAHLYCEKKFNVKQRYDCISEVDQFYQTLDYIKLNGDINQPSGGYIFSPQEYGAGSAKEPIWYDEVARDFYKYTFIFIGTTLKEPLFYHQIEKYKAKTNSSDMKSYVLIPELTPLQTKGLEASNIHHLQGKLSDFVDWLNSEFVTPPTSKDLIKNIRPELDFDNKENISLFSDVTPVNRASLALLPKNTSETEIREFYKGFKPTWFDIIDEVPAFLSNSKNFFAIYLADNKAKPLDLYLMLGSAGCGKSTALKQLALKVSDLCDKNVYFVDEYKDNFKQLVVELDTRHKEPYYLFIERIGDMAPEIADIIKYAKSQKAIFVSAESSSIWASRVKEHLNNYVTSEIDISFIDDSDANIILEKIEKFGNWTRLAKMSTKNRKIELLKKSKQQLLIGLMEATSGEGYNEIVKNDYQSISCEAQRALLILAGLATTQRVPANEATLTRALSYLDVNPNVHFLASQMEGVLKFSNGNVTTRHRVYIDKLFNMYVPTEVLLKTIVAYIKAFSVYQFPIVKNISRNEASIYKHLVNAKFLKRLLKNQKEVVLSVYERFEKVFENEGLFLMQYGLALRTFDRQPEAYEKLRIAHQAFPESAHIEHALAQQRIILACQEDNETIAMAHFDEAERVLKRLNSSDIRVFDHYPIITLSEGHVKVLDKFGHIPQAKILAKTYHDSISKNSTINANGRVKQTLSNLAKYYINGVWLAQNDHELES
ncbi:MAG TPA: SIR2 family protein [Methylobacter sp.]